MQTRNTKSVLSCFSVPNEIMDVAIQQVCCQNVVVVLVELASPVIRGVTILLQEVIFNELSDFQSNFIRFSKRSL